MKVKENYVWQVDFKNSFMIEKMKKSHNYPIAINEKWHHVRLFLVFKTKIKKQNYFEPFFFFSSQNYKTQISF